MSDDAELLRRYAETRDEPAFAALVERHLGLVYAAALRRLDGDPHRATEITQTVFIALARHAHDLAQRPVLASWLHTATRHAVIDLLRVEQRRRTREQHAHTLATVNTSQSTSADAEWDQLRPLLDAALDQLPETDRALLLLRFFEQHPFADIAARLHLTEDAARMRTARALEKLRTHLARRGITSTATALGTALTTQPLSAAPAGLATTITTGALIGATGTTALITSNIFLMSTATKAILAAAGILTAAAIGSAVYEARLAQNATLAAADLQRERDALRIQTAVLETRLSETSVNLARTTALQKETEGKLAKVPAVPQITAAPKVNLMWANPDFARNYLAKERASLGTRFGQLYRELHLSPEQISKFENAQMEHRQSLVDIWTEATARGLSNMETSVVRLTAEPAGLFNSTVRALLGASGYDQYQQFEKGKGARDLVTSLAGSIYFTETPLTGEQGTQLAQIIKANTEMKKNPMNDDGKKTIFAHREETDWTAVNTQAQGLLSPPQLATLKILVELKRLQDEEMQILSPSAK